MHLLQGKKFLCGTICLLLCAASLASADEDESNKREQFVEPIITEETFPNKVGEWDLRMSLEFKGDGGLLAAFFPRLQLFGGLVPRLGVEVNVPQVYQKETSAYGLGDVSAGLKWLFVKNKDETFATVLGAEAGFPTGSQRRQTGKGTYEFAPFLALLKDFGRFSLQGNLAWSQEWAQAGGGRADRFEYNGALAAPLPKNLHLLAKINGIRGAEAGENGAALASSVKYNLNPEMFVAAAAPFGLNAAAADWGIVTQFQIGF